MTSKLQNGFMYGTCPVCGSNWDGGPIIEKFIHMRNNGNEHWLNKSDDDIRRSVEGWTDDEILAFADRHMSFDSEERMQKFITQDRKVLGKYLYDKFGIEIRGSYSPPYRFSRVIGVEIQGYDGISYWQCPDCNQTWNRWTKQEEQIKGISIYSGYSDKII